MSTEKSETTAEVQIRKLIEERIKAVHTKDLELIMSNYASNLVLFNALPPLQSFGTDEERNSAQKWFSSYQSAIGYEVRELQITASEEVAFCHFLYRVSGTQTSGAEVNMWVRATVCFQKLDGQWSVTHEHNSVPFDPENGKALTSLQP